MGIWAIPLTLALPGLLLGIAGDASVGDTQDGNEFLKVYPIGYVRKADAKTFIEVDDNYKDGLLGLDGFTHVQVFWWFHKNDTPQKRKILRVYPRGNRKNPLTGVFACRAPVRPNLIALTPCKILSLEGRRVYIEKIDAFDGTPVVDLKPYAPGIDRVMDARGPAWARRK